MYGIADVTSEFMVNVNVPLVAGVALESNEKITPNSLCVPVYRLIGEPGLTVSLPISPFCLYHHTSVLSYNADSVIFLFCPIILVALKSIGNANRAS